MFCKIIKRSKQAKKDIAVFVTVMIFGYKGVLLLLCFYVLFGCKSVLHKKFSQIPSTVTSIDFQNTIVEDENINVINYDYLYNGGGVAVGDLNNDGLCDIYFTANETSNRLYLNQGNFKFKDVTEISQVAGRSRWKTGVTIADVNGDGWLDIYVCYSGPVSKDSLSNELYINNGCEKGGVPTFTEKAQEYGIDAPYTFSTQAAFFDYDNDGDLDMFLLNHSTNAYYPFINTGKLRTKRHPQFGDKLYKNTNGKFSEVSESAGIYGGGLNFGLGIAVSDFNNDGWLDIYVTNDFEEQDYFYLNNRNGTFQECSKRCFGHLSMFSMGADAADFNNDGRSDIMVLDMLPEDNHRQKLLKGADDYNKYQRMIDSGFYYQNMRNTLQLNRGVFSKDYPVFSEIGQVAGISNTDWSWAILFADLDNDGWKDVFITNGFLHDYTNRDFLKYAADASLQEARKNGDKKGIFDLVKRMPSTKISNYVFQNKGNLTFENSTKKWGMELNSVSSGAAYADLDNDGDLDLIVNNINSPATLWRNNTESNKPGANHFIGIKLSGYGLNTFGIGAKVEVTTPGNVQMQELIPTRGYQSSVDYVLHFGIGANDSVKEVKVKWPDGRINIVKSLNANQVLAIDHADSFEPQKDQSIQASHTLFTEINTVLNFQHKEDTYVDYYKEPLLPYQFSRMGPFASIDSSKHDQPLLFIGGAAVQPGGLFVANPATKSYVQIHQHWGDDSLSEDIGSVFFDADGDKHDDLYVVSGGNQYPVGSQYYQDRLYLNKGNGNFIKSKDALPIEAESGSCVVAADFDKDGDIDLFVGGHVVPGSFPEIPESFILLNNGKGKFERLPKYLPGNGRIGMITSAKVIDINNDKWPDLIVAGDWMPLTILLNNKKGSFIRLQNPSLDSLSGFWSAVSIADIDGDGDLDIVAGNMGGNIQWRPTQKQPIELYYGDFMHQNKVLPIMCAYVQGVSYPILSLDDITDQLPFLKKKFLFYKDYADAQITDILEPAFFQQSSLLKVNCTESSVFINKGNGTFERKALPIEAQFSRIAKILIEDFNADGIPDLLIAGNYDEWRVQYGRMDACMGLLLIGEGHGNFKPIDNQISGLHALGQVRDLTKTSIGGKAYWVFMINNSSVQVYSQINKIKMFKKNNNDHTSFRF